MKELYVEQEIRLKSLDQCITEGYIKKSYLDSYPTYVFTNKVFHNPGFMSDMISRFGKINKIMGFPKTHKNVVKLKDKYWYPVECITKDHLKLIKII